MKLFALLAVVGMAAAAHLGTPGSVKWSPNTEYVFDYEGRLLTGIPELDATHFSGMAIKCRVLLQVESIDRLSIRIKDPTYTKVSNKLSPSGADQESENWRFIRLPEYKPFPNDIILDFAEPAVFEVTPDDGGIRGITVSASESSWTINIKKALINLFQTRNMEHGGGLRPSGKSDGIPRNWIAFEETIDGECETHYEMTEIPLSQVTEERLLPHPRFCPKAGGNPLKTNVYHVTKTRNLENCLRRASYSSYKPGSFNCKGGNCGGQWARSSVTRYVVCGNPDNYVIQSIVNEGELNQDPLGYQSEKILTGTRQVIKLMNVHRSGIAPTTPANPTQLTNSMYELPTTKSMHTSKDSGDLDLEKLKKEVTGLMEEVVKSDINRDMDLPSRELSMKVLVAAKIFRVFNVQQLHQIWDKLVKEGSHRNPVFVKNVVIDTMLLSGSSDSVRLFKVLVHEGQFSSSQIGSVFAALPRTIATPNEELLEELFYFIQSDIKGKGERPYYTSLLSLSNIIQKACLSSNSETSYPTWYYGKFCTAESSIITEKWIPFLQQELEQGKSSEHKNVVLVALGLLSHQQIIPAVLPILEEPEHMSPIEPTNVGHLTRYLAVYSLLNVGKYQPKRILPILTALYTNKAERTEIRIAAFQSIMTLKPDMALLQKIATLTWVEEDLEVLKVVNTAFYSLTQQVSMQHYEPSSSLLVRQVRLLYPFIKKEGGHFPSSAVIFGNAFFRKMSAGYESIITWTGSRGSLMPSSMYTKFVYFFDEYKFSPLEVGVHLCGVETVTQEILDLITGEDKSEEEIESQLNPEWKEAINKLRIKTREGGNLEGAFYTDFFETSSLFYSFKSEGARAVREEVRRIMKNPSTIKNYLDGEGGVNFQRVLNLGPIEFVLPSDMGLPIAVEYNKPAMIAVTGKYANNVLSSGGSISSFDAKVHAFVDARVTGWVGTYSPVDDEYIITGIDQHFSVELPFEMEIKADINEGKVSFHLKTKPSGDVPSPTSPFPLVYYRVLPYTVSQSIYNLLPVFINPRMHNISSGNELIREEVRFGEAFGLNFKLQSKAETSHLGLRLLWEKLYSYNWNPFNFIRFFWANGAVTATGKPSARQLEAKVIFDPSTSPTNSVEVIWKFGYGSKVKGESIKYHALEIAEGSGRSPLKLVSKPVGTLSRQTHRQEKIKSILKKINVDSDGRAVTVSVTAALKGGSRPKVYSWSLTAGTGNTGLKQKWNLKVQSDSNPRNAYCVTGEVDLPFLPEWSISKMRSQSPNIHFENVIGAGNDCSESKLVIKGSSRTSQKQKEWSKTSPEGREYDRLASKGAQGIKLSELAAKVRHQASALDIIDYKIDYVNIPSYAMYFPKKLMEIVKVYWFPYYNSSVPNFESSSDTGAGGNIQTIGQTRIHPDIQTYDVLIKNSGDTSSQYYYTDIPLQFPWNYIYPFSYVQSVTDKLAKITTGGSAYPTCNLVGETVVTFDNKTIGSGVDQCMHLLSGDCGHSKEYGVFVRSIDSSHYGESKKEMKIYVRGAEVELRGVNGGGFNIKINGHPISIHGQDQEGVTNAKGAVVGVLSKSSDDVIAFNSPKVSVFFDGTDVVVKGSMMMKNRLCGLCGDNNNQKIADLTSPEMCLLSKPEIMVASYRVPLGSESCKPLPQLVAEQLEKETKGKCLRASFKSTKVVAGYESTSPAGKCTQHAHELVEKGKEYCFSKIPLVGCGSLCRPGASGEKRVAYTCMRKDRVSERIAEKVRRGDVVTSLKNFPTTYTTVRRLPVTCEPIFRHKGQQY